MMKKFLCKFSILFVIILGITVGINFLYESKVVNYDTMCQSRNNSGYISEVPSGIELCDFGNSHGYFSFDYEDAGNKYVCFNFGLQDQSMTYNYRVLQNYKENIQPGAVVYVCASFGSFFGIDETEKDNFESKNKRYYHFLEPKYIKNYDANTAFFVKYIPALSVSLPEMVDTISGKIEIEDLWAMSTNPDDAKDHASHRYGTQIATTVDDRGVRIYNDAEIQAMIDLIKQVQDMGCTPILISTPLLSEFTDTVQERDPEFFVDFYDVVDKVKEETGVPYYDYQFDERFKHQYDWFFNTDHMNRNGAKVFTKILIEETLTEKTDD